MTLEHLRTFAFIILWAIGAIVLANMLVTPVAVRQPRSASLWPVKKVDAIYLDKDDIYDMEMQR